MKIQTFIYSLVVVFVMTLVSFEVALANEYIVPVIIDGEIYSVTVTVEGGRVISATSEVEGVEIGDISLKVAPGSEVITDTNLLDMIISNDFPSFPAGEPDEVSVVYTAIGNDILGSGRLYVVVRNNTDSTIYNVKAEADLYDSNGDYLGTEDNLYNFHPSIVPPGGISASFIYFPDLELSESDEFEIYVDYSESARNSADSFLEITEFRKSSRNSSIVGRVKNSGDATLTGINIYSLCYDDEDGSVDYTSGDINVESLEPGEAARFTVEANCSQFLLYSMGKTE